MKRIGWQRDNRIPSAQAPDPTEAETCYLLLFPPNDDPVQYRVFTDPDEATACVERYRDAGVKVRTYIAVARDLLDEPVLSL